VRVGRMATLMKRSKVH